MIDQALLSELQYCLLEPPDGGQSFPSEVWRREEVIEAVNAAERQLLRRTHLLITRTEIPVPAPSSPVTLPLNWLATAHLVWREGDTVDENGTVTATGARVPLAPVDVTEANLGNPDWRDGGDPLGYDDRDSETRTIRVVPTPHDDGTIELLYVAVPTPVNGNGRSFTVPDDYLSAVKYGALETLLGKVGRLQDPERAAYSRRRVDLLVAAAEVVLGGWA